MTRQPSPTGETATPSSWAGFKDLARRQYERGDYDSALTSYTAALNPDLHCPPSEQQIILSNLVACRLKIGGAAQARAAVENAKKCVALNPQWSKGHVRLATAYIALGGHSNDACNELQRALALDAGNSTARQLLVKELRRDHAHASSAAANSNNNSSSNINSSSRSRSSNSRSEFDEFPAYPQQQEQRQQQHYDVDESFTWYERLQFYMGRTVAWYQRQSDDVKTLLKILVVLLCLYVGFGGRFGLGGSSRPTGNYGSDNVYNQYRQHGTTLNNRQHKNHDNTHTQGYGRNSGSSKHRRASSSYGNQHKDYQDDHYHDEGYQYPTRNRGGSSWYGGGGFNPLDGGLQSMLLLSGLAFAGHRMGINPFQTMMFLNMMGGGRRRFRPRGGFGMGGFGGFGGMGGMGGMGYRRRRF